MLDTIEMMLQAKCHILADQLCLVGVSGGPDSICLLHSLHTLGYHLIGVHVNHGLRPEADQEAVAVERFVTGLGIEFIAFQADVTTYADEHSLSIEEAAREIRYRHLFEQAEKSRASAVLVAHTADDQVETLLMHLLRGSGLTGLRGMEYRSLPNPWSKRIPLVRPLLSTWREEIMQYLAENQISYVTDQSNYDVLYTRNRLRHELLPVLEQYNPRIRQSLLQMSQINRDDYEQIQQSVDSAWEKNLVRQGYGYLAFCLRGFCDMSTSLQRYILRKAIAYHLPSLRDIDFASIERGISFLCTDQLHGQVDLIAGLRLLKEGELFWLAAWQADLPGSDFPAIPASAQLMVDIPGRLLLNDGWVLQVIEEPDAELAIQQSYANQSPFQAWLDCSELSLPLIARARKTGDRFEPLGMLGHSLKVTDLMINLKIPRRARPTWPLICSGATVVWIPGYRQSHQGRIHPHSQRIIHLLLSKGLDA